MAIDNKKVGESAVNHLEAHFNRANNVLTHFEKNDTGVCVDGAIEVYTGTAMTKDALYGEIPVQIKGTLSKPSGSGIEKRKVDVLDLEKYLDVYAGVLYFVVFMDKYFNLRGIYYKQYLPYDIHEALNRKKRDDQATLTEKFLPLPDEPDQLRRLCLEFVSDQRKQRGTSDVGFLMPGELETAGIRFEKLELTKTLFSDELPVSLEPFKTGAYLYGTTSSGKRYVVERIGSLESIQASSHHRLRAGDFECECEIAVGEDRSGGFIRTGGLSLQLQGPGTFNYTDRGGFRSRLRDAKLFRGLVQSGEIYFDGSLLGRVDTFDDVDLDELDARIETYEKYVTLMDLLGIVPDWNPKTLTEKEMGQVNILGKGLVDGRHLSLDGHSESMVVFGCEIAGAFVKVLGRMDTDGRYELFDLISPALAFVASTDGDAELDVDNPMPALFSLTGDDFCRVANISHDKLEKALTTCPITNGNADTVTNKLLEMLNAYDDGAVCGHELLLCCDITSKGLIELSPLSEINIINRAQVLVRMNAFEDEWKARIRKLAVTNANLEVRASAHIILGESELAEACLDTFEDMERARFMTWPIYHLLRR